MLEAKLSTPVNLRGDIYRGVGGTSDYNDLDNKPTYNGHIIEGDMTSESLGIWQPKNFSTQEQDTGIKWIDGKTIYQITIINISVPTNGAIYINTPISIEHLVNYFGNAYNADLSNQRPLPFSGGSQSDIRIDYVNHQLRMVTFADWSGYSAYITIQYTKSTD